MWFSFTIWLIPLDLFLKDSGLFWDGKREVARPALCPEDKLLWGTPTEACALRTFPGGGGGGMGGGVQGFCLKSSHKREKVWRSL